MYAADKTITTNSFWLLGVAANYDFAIAFVTFHALHQP